MQAGRRKTLWSELSSSTLQGTGIQLKLPVLGFKCLYPSEPSPWSQIIYSLLHGGCTSVRLLL